MGTITLGATEWREEAAKAQLNAAFLLANPAPYGDVDRQIKAGQLLAAAERFNGRAAMIELGHFAPTVVELEE